MAISSAKYDSFGNIIAIIDDKEYTVPDNRGNRHRRMIAEWERDGNTIEEYKEPEIDLDELDQRELNAILTQEGSVLRAVAELFLEEINRLRDRAGLSTYSKQQFVTALRAKMRD